ncbi:MAG: FAD:protein FMN transferase [Gemmatimonadota bacterium]
MHRIVPAGAVLAVACAAILAAGTFPTTRGGPSAIPPEMPPPATGTPLPGPAVVAEREAWAMGAPLRVRAAGSDRETAVRAIERAFLEVERLEAELSSWREDSDLGRLRAAPAGTPVRVRARTAALLSEAADWVGRTGGAFDPAIGALVDAWDLRGGGRIPAPAELEAALASSRWERIRLDAAAGTVERADGAAWIDAGGFGKGAALRSAAEALRAGGASAALLDFGGQLAVLGDDPADGGPGWPVAVAHPARRDSALLAGRLLHGSLATSGDSERSLDGPHGRIGHLLDPRTGAPAPAWGSVTVAADDPLAADVLATALFVMGPREGARWIDGRADAGALFLLDRGDAVEVVFAGALEGRLRLEATRTVSRPRPRAASRDSEAGRN